MILTKKTLIIPKKHCERLITPPIKKLSDAIEANGILLNSSNVNILNASLSDHRNTLRPLLLQHSKAYMSSIGLSSPESKEKNGFVVTGHQCQFFHPGITIKYALTDDLAKQTDAVPINLIVDTDTSKNLGLTIPVLKNDNTLAITTLYLNDIDTDITVSNQPLPQQETFSTFCDSFLNHNIAGVSQSQKENIVTIFKTSYQQAKCLTDFYCLTNFNSGHIIHHNMFHLPVSIMAQTKTFYSFCYDMIVNSDDIFRYYNNALNAYRTTHQLRNKNQPLPNLRKSNDGFIESPFWLLTPNQPRAPLFIKHHGSDIVIADQNKPVGLFSGNSQSSTEDFMHLLKANNLTIAPRAITLSIFARLFIGDMFVHGTGGARYDLISDKIISDYYNITPPQICAATITMHLPIKVQHDATIIASQIDEAKNTRRALRYNSEKHVDNIPAQLIYEKVQLIERHKILKGTKGNKQSKRAIFNALMQIRDKMKCHAKDAISENQVNIDELQMQLNQNKIAQGREYFTGLFTKASLDKALKF
jgi:hypothetical protein